MSIAKKSDQASVKLIEKHQKLLDSILDDAIKDASTVLKGQGAAADLDRLKVIQALKVGR